MKRSTLTFGAVILLTLSICVLVLMVLVQRQKTVMRRFILSGPAALARESSAAQKMNIPLSPQSLQSPMPPPAQNAAPYYIALTDLLTKKSLPVFFDKYEKNIVPTYTPEQIAMARQTLAQRSDVMALVHQAAGKPQCVFTRDWSQGMNLKFPEYTAIREAARLIKMESYLQAHDGHYQKAVLNQALGFRVARHSSSDHTLISFLVGTACDNITLSGMQSILVQAGPNALVDVQVGDTVSRLSLPPSLRTAMAGDAGFGCVLFARMHQSERYGVDAALSAAGYTDGSKKEKLTSVTDEATTHSLIDAWEADYLAHMTPLVKACEEPRTVRRAAFLAAGLKLDRESNTLYGQIHLLTLLMAPVFTDIDITQTRNQAHKAVTLAAAYVLGEKAKTGTFPTALPARFADPFTDKPLGYRLEGANGFVVYSAGPDGTFYGGKPGEKTPPIESLFRYPVTNRAAMQ